VAFGHRAMNRLCSCLIPCLSPALITLVAEMDEAPALPAEAQFGDDRAIARHIVAVEIRKETTPAADHAEQSASTVVVLLVRPEMLVELVDVVRQKRDLDFNRAGIPRRSPVFLYEVCFSFCCQHDSYIRV
jgi:hypothetical protein